MALKNYLSLSLFKIAMTTQTTSTNKYREENFISIISFTEKKREEKMKNSFNKNGHKIQ